MAAWNFEEKKSAKIEIPLERLTKGLFYSASYLYHRVER